MIIMFIEQNIISIQYKIKMIIYINMDFKNKKKMYERSYKRIVRFYLYNI